MAVSCPHCGYPLDNKNEQPHNMLYDIIITELSDDCDKIKAIGIIKGINGTGLAETKKLIETPNQVVFKGMEYDSANSAKNALASCGVNTKIVTSDIKESNTEENKANITFKNYDINTIICPHCGSTAVTTGQKGFSLLTGFLGSNKTVNRCGKCGWTWQPR